MQEKEQTYLYRIIFFQEEKIYEVYAKYISEDHLVGFIQIEELVFTEPSSVLVDPSEEKLKIEFQGVKRCYIPMHMILRIDEIEEQGAAKIKDAVHQDNVRHFPGAFKKPLQEKE